MSRSSCCAPPTPSPPPHRRCRPPTRSLPAPRSRMEPSCPGEDGLGRTAQPAPPEPPVRIGGPSARRLEVRLRRQPRPQLRDDPPAACSGLGERRCRRRHGARADGRHGRHGRELHDRQARLLAESTGGVRRRRLRRWRSCSARTRRLRARRDRGRYAGAADVPPPVHGR